MMFKCDTCELEMDFDEDETEIIECFEDGCNGIMWMK